MENWEAWLSLAVALLLMVSLTMRIAPHDLVALSCLGILMVAQSISGTDLLPTPDDAVAGFGNQGLVTIGLLFAVVAGLEFTGGTELATGWFLNRAKNLRSALIRLLV
ncbi:SLC13 family permease, partial [bacterium]|nr:SLC13 family permease [bacterium]